MIDDQGLAGRLATDLDAHFEQLVQSYQHRLFGFALRLTGRREDAEECTQDAFVRAYRALGRYPTERRAQLRLRPWLYQITLNVVRNQVRRPALVAVSVDSSEADALPSRADQQPEAMALQREGWGRLEAALQGLPARYKTAVVLRHVHGLSYVEAAEVLEQPVGTTKSDVHRGLRLLREVLERQPYRDNEREGHFEA